MTTFAPGGKKGSYTSQGVFGEGTNVSLLLTNRHGFLPICFTTQPYESAKLILSRVTTGEIWAKKRVPAKHDPHFFQLLPLQPAALLSYLTGVYECLLWNSIFPKPLRAFGKYWLAVVGKKIAASLLNVW